MSDFIVNSGLDTKEISVIDDEKILINGKVKNYALYPLTAKKYLLKIDNNIYEALINSNSQNDYEIIIDQNLYKINVLTTLQAKALKLIQSSMKDNSENTVVKSPMPGMILKVNKKAGDEVKKGETILVLEAMKMENEIKSPLTGIITSLNVEPGRAIEKNIALFSIK